MPLFQDGEIGPKFDIGLATRDATTLPCLDSEGRIRNLSRMAYMFSTRHPQKESADLISKEKMTRLSSPNIIDREFSLHPQATQGDWSGGQLQRVFVEPNRYYDGRGIIWPIPGYQVGQPAAATAITPLNPVNANRPAVGLGVVNTQTIAYAYQDNAAAERLEAQTDGEGTPTAVVAGGAVQSIIVFLRQIFFSTGTANLQTALIAAGPVFSIVNWATNALGANLAAGIAGATGYIASWSGTSNIRLHQVTSLGSSTAFTDIPIPVGTVMATVGLATGAPTSVVFLGSQVIYAVTDNTSAYIIAYDVPSATQSMLATLPGVRQISICALHGSVFIVGLNFAGANTVVQLFLLTGSSLQYIGTLPSIITGSFGSPLGYGRVSTLSNCTTFGPYVFWNMAGPTSNLVVFAYDVQRGALFRLMDTIATANAATIVAGGARITDLSTAQWILVAGLSNINPQVSRISPFTGGAAPVYTLVNGSIISSTIDFTSATLKFYRQVVVDHAPITAGNNIYLAVFLDQDPDSLAAVPDFSITNSTAGSKQTVLIVNKAAVKLIWELDWAVNKIISVKVQAATGWIWDNWLTISDSAKINGQNPQSFCYQSQESDAKAAYNFIRNIWRLKGGLCTATFANGDKWPAVLELVESEDPKPFKMLSTADKKPHYESTMRVVLRQDG